MPIKSNKKTGESTWHHVPHMVYGCKGIKRQKEFHSSLSRQKASDALRTKAS